MNITKISQQTTNKMTKFFQEKGDFGESVNIAMDFVGKAAVTPALIMLSPSKDATKDEKTFAAIKNPIGATIQLACEVPILIGVSKAVEKMANNGTFDKENSDFSYNVKNAQDIFVKTVKENDNIDENLIKELEEKGLSKKLNKSFDEVIEFMSDNSKIAFENLKNADKRLYHLSNRIVFLAAILTTPIITLVESTLHTKITNKMQNKGAKND